MQFKKFIPIAVASVASFGAGAGVHREATKQAEPKNFTRYCNEKTDVHDARSRMKCPHCGWTNGVWHSSGVDFADYRKSNFACQPHSDKHHLQCAWCEKPLAAKKPRRGVPQASLGTIPDDFPGMKEFTEHAEQLHKTWKAHNRGKRSTISDEDLKRFEDYQANKRSDSKPPDEGASTARTPIPPEHAPEEDKE